MRYHFLTKWIQELSFEISRAKQQQNLQKAAELQWLREDLLDLRDN